MGRLNKVSKEVAYNILEVITEEIFAVHALEYTTPITYPLKEITGEPVKE